MTEVTAKKVILKNKDGEYLIPYTENGGGGLEVGDIGIAALGIDESKGLRRYLNGSILTANANTQGFINKLKSAAALYPSLICTETQWQGIASTSVGGQCGKFVIDETAGTVRLPKIIMPIQGLTDLTSLGTIVGAGLPNIEGWWQQDLLKEYSATSASGAMQARASGLPVNNSAGGGTGGGGINFDASKSNPIYGNSDTVQPEAVQYPYFIQIATGQETEVNITNEIELNNPFFFGMSQYFDVEPNNLSWLKSEGQWNSKAVYPTAYEKLLKVYNGTETVEGLSVKLSTEEYTDYDFVLNTADETFRLPLKNGLEGMFAGQAVVGNRKALGLTDGTSEYSATGFFTNGSTGITIGAQNNASLPATGTYNNATTNALYGVSTNPANSNLIVAGEVPDGFALYYYVGETVQNANLINAGRFGELVSTKANIDLSNCTRPYVTETYANGTSWYRVWSDGWIEQGGISPSGADQATPTVTLLKAFSNANYNVVAIQRDGPSGNYTNGLRIVNYTTESFQINYRTGGNTTAYWQACGY